MKKPDLIENEFYAIRYRGGGWSFGHLCNNGGLMDSDPNSIGWVSLDLLDRWILMYRVEKMLDEATG